LQKVGERNIELEKTEVAELDALSEAGIRKSEDEKAPLSQIISTINKSLQPILLMQIGY
jgi:hypothetical protein